MSDLTSILNGPWSPPSQPIPASPEDQLRSSMQDADIDPPDDIYLDGKIHRFKTGSKGSGGHGDKTGWYVAYGDGVPAGRFGDWRTGVEITWRANIGRLFTPAEEMAHTRRMAEAKAQRDAELQRSREVASDTVESIWSNCMAAHPDHPYLKRKGIGVNGARITGDGRLVVPLFDKDGTLSSLQYIDSNGIKLYHPGGATGSKFWMIGTMDEPGTLYGAEGFATAATIHETTNRPCVVAYSASNLVPVTGILRELYGKDQDIVIVADNDASGVGHRYAEQACAKHGAHMVMPPIPGDANDYAASGNDLAALLIPATGQTVIDKLKVVFGDQLPQEYDAPDELVEGLMTIGSLTVVYGDSNSGKTFWALALATAIATGLRFFGRQTDPGLVIYLASESPSSIKSRMQALKKYHNLDLSDLAMVPVPMNFYNGDQDARDVIELVKAVEIKRKKPVRLIIGDTLARMSAGANENSGEDMGPVMARFDQVAQASKAALTIIHHNGKDAAKGSRGWSGIRAHIDTEIEVVEKDGIRTANVTKQRELPGKGETIYFKLHIMEMGMGKFGNAATTCVAIPDDDAKNSPKKKDSGNASNIRTFENAWFATGVEDIGGAPYVSKSAFFDYLISNHGLSATAAKNELDPTKTGKLISNLLTSETIKDHQNGWIMVDESCIAAMQISKHNR